MGCACGNKGATAPKSWTVRNPDGTSKAYRTEVEAIAAAKRSGGTYAPAK